MQTPNANEYKPKDDMLGLKATKIVQDNFQWPYMLNEG
jgi:hypothetical protein